jgi:hypothetical protein
MRHVLAIGRGDLAGETRSLAPFGHVLDVHRPGAGPEPVPLEIAR